jgi:type I restriction enzyme M protein
MYAAHLFRAEQFPASNGIQTRFELEDASIVARYYAKEQAAIEQLAAELETVMAKLADLEEEHGGEDGAFSELDKINKANVVSRLNEIEGDKDAKDDAVVLNNWLKLNGKEADLKKRFKEAEAELDVKAYAHYPKLTESQIKSLVVDDKWLAAMDAAIRGEMDQISQTLTGRIKELAERYGTPLPEMVRRVADLEDKVNGHLKRMGFAW